MEASFLPGGIAERACLYKDWPEHSNHRRSGIYLRTMSKTSHLFMRFSLSAFYCVLITILNVRFSGNAMAHVVTDRHSTRAPMHRKRRFCIGGCRCQCVVEVVASSDIRCTGPGSLISPAAPISPCQRSMDGQPRMRSERSFRRRNLPIHLSGSDSRSLWMPFHTFTFACRLIFFLSLPST